MESVTNLIMVNSNPKLDVSPQGDFFRVWTEFLQPLHHLTNREMDVFAAFLKKRYELSKAISDPEVLDKMLMSEKVKREIRLQCKMAMKHFQVIMCRFRQKGVIKNDKIYLNLIPSLTNEGVGLMIYFNFKHEERVKLGPRQSSPRD